MYTYVGGKLRRYDPSAGTILDTIAVSTTTTSTTSKSTVPVFGADGTAYLLSTPLLYAFDPLTKRLLWQGGSNVSGVPALAEGVLLVIDEGELTARDPQTGDLLWTAHDTAELTYGPVAAHGFAYVASAQKTYAVDLKNGAVVWQADGGGWLSIGSGRLLVAENNGILRSYLLTQPAAEP